MSEDRFTATERAYRAGLTDALARRAPETLIARLRRGVDSDHHPYEASYRAGYLQGEREGRCRRSRAHSAASLKFVDGNHARAVNRRIRGWVRELELPMTEENVERTAMGCLIAGGVGCGIVGFMMVAAIAALTWRLIVWAIGG